MVLCGLYNKVYLVQIPSACQPCTHYRYCTESEKAFQIGIKRIKSPSAKEHRGTCSVCVSLLSILSSSLNVKHRGYALFPNKRTRSKQHHQGFYLPKHIKEVSNHHILSMPEDHKVGSHDRNLSDYDKWSSQLLPSLSVAVRDLRAMFLPGKKSKIESTCVIEGNVYCQITCRRPVSGKWHTQPKNISMQWTLMENTCSSLTQCWNNLTETNKPFWETGQYRFPQLCPLELQLGDVVFVSADSNLKQYGFQMNKVSKEEFENCLILELQQEKLMLDHRTYCERKRLLCDSNPCWNDGRCEETANGYVCTCPGGFTGLNCETTTETDSYCKSGGCQLDEACATFKHNSTCVCLNPECSEQAEVCGTLPCFNGGTCVVHNGEFHCRCRQGYSGRNCEEIIDFCKLLSIDCLNEGLCLNLVGGYNCFCAPGWKGEFCQYLENACMAYPNRCMNGATCISMSQPTAPPHYMCTCLPGYT
ncbi:hypothetical protein DNTS_003937, partial [Danionella cerebrum]